ncbi:MAG: hypothetical protein AAF639_18890 [Chloroflexota bacterium]
MAFVDNQATTIIPPIQFFTNEPPTKLASSTVVHIDKKTAQRAVNEWLVMHVSCMMMTTGEPVLDMLDEQPIWRLKAVLTAPHVGHVGKVGEVTISAVDGEILQKDEVSKQLLAKADKLVVHIPPYKPRPKSSTPFVIPHPPRQDGPSGDPLAIIARAKSKKAATNVAK